MVEEQTVLYRYARVKGQTETLYLQSKAVPVHSMKASGEVDIWLHSFLTAELDGRV